MLHWWTYTIGLSAILSTTAWVTERLARSRGRPSRLAWLLALAGGGLWPLFLWLAPDAAAPVTVGRALSIRTLLPLRNAAMAIYGQLPSLDGWLSWVWLVASICLVTTGWASHRCLVVAARRCEERTVAGVAVRVSATEGPAVCGVLRPRILLPSWIMGTRPIERRLALVHELSHVRAGDVLLIWAGYLLVCAMPWNPVAWLMFGRLRQAVEIDCDRRVLARHADRRTYGELLVRTARARSPALAIAPGLLARRSSLSRRIEHLGRRDRAPWSLSSALIIPVAGSLAAAALLPPPAPFGWVHRLEEVSVTASPGGEAQPEPAGEVFRATEIPDPGTAPPAGGATGTWDNVLRRPAQAHFEARGESTIREVPRGRRATARVKEGGTRP